MSLFRPDYYVSNFENINIDRLKKEGSGFCCAI